MKKVLMIVMCALLCASCIVLAAGCAEISVDDLSSPGDLSEGDEAPDFTAELAGGETFTLSDHKDEVVLLDFWATWCGYCIDEMPDVQRLQDDGIDGLTIVAVNCAEAKAQVDAFRLKTGYTFNFAYDEDGVISSQYPTSAIPCTVIVYKGKVKKIFIGASPDAYEEFKSAAEECLNE